MFEILINKDDKQKEIALLENGKLIEYYTDEENSNRKEGNIYIGVICDVIKGMQAAFVDIGTEKNSIKLFFSVPISTNAACIPFITSHITPI